ncbi:MAG: hypothetical protein ACREDI_15180, partial [Roseiarcus sp.]
APSVGLPFGDPRVFDVGRPDSLDARRTPAETAAPAGDCRGALTAKGALARELAANGTATETPTSE